MTHGKPVVGTIDTLALEGDPAAKTAPNLVPRPGSILLLSVWSGLVAGLLEVGTIVLRKTFFDPNHLYGMSRHFVWIIPAANVCLFIATGSALGAAGYFWPRRGGWLATRTLCALTMLPPILIAFPRIYTMAWAALAGGVAIRLTPILEAHRRGLLRVARWSFPVALVIWIGLGTSPFVVDRIKHAREAGRPLPPPGSPNVLFIVLDTVAAGHLSLYGYPRPTSTALAELGERGIRFDSVQAACSWTLPSHATMFTGRWMHDLSVGWLNPLDATRPTLAEYLGAHGYATAGFVANTVFCARDTGLARGFTHYEDFIFPRLTALKTAVLAQRALAAFGRLLPIVEKRPALAWVLPHLQEAWQSFVFDRKRAATVSAEFSRWMARRTQPERPFFAFLNFSDAHTPYELGDNRLHRFGVAQPDERQRELIRRWGDLDKVRLIPSEMPLVVDAYDDCVADLDEQIGRMLDRLGRQGALKNTWLIVASDHGESFGEHAGVFCHGTSLYQTELHVPLLIVPPRGQTPKRVVKSAVSLRDLAATVVDVLGFDVGSPFPGMSLARHWRDAVSVPEAAAVVPLPLSEVVPGFAINVDAYGLPRKSMPLGAVTDGEWSYIRGEGTIHEELFHLRADANQLRNLVREPGARGVLDRMRQSLRQLADGPLVPERFNR